jgi:release factor glutamine methyltransferase
MVARRNAERNRVVIEFLQGSLLEPVAGRQFDLIVSNPPYIPSCDMENLQPEVRDFDPRVALDGGTDGLDVYSALIPDAAAFLTSGGWLLLEVGIGQSADVAEMFRTAGSYGEPIIACDQGGIERVVGAFRS